MIKILARNWKLSFRIKYFICGKRVILRCVVVVITTAQLHSTKPELRFYAGSNPACGMSEMCDTEDLWQWSWLEIRLNTFCWSVIPQKQFNIFIIIFISFLSLSFKIKTPSCIPGSLVQEKSLCLSLKLNLAAKNSSSCFSWKD